MFSDHHHFFFEDTGQLLDIPDEYVTVSGLPKPPTGAAPHQRNHLRAQGPRPGRRLEIF